MPRELSALTTTLAQMCADSTNRARSLKSFCELAQADRTPYEPPVLDTRERLLWHAGFYEAMRLVLEYIEDGTPQRPAVSIKHPR